MGGVVYMASQPQIIRPPLILLGAAEQVWGFYLCLAPSSDLTGEHFLIPWLETFWYVGQPRV